MKVHHSQFRYLAGTGQVPQESMIYKIFISMKRLFLILPLSLLLFSCNGNAQKDKNQEDFEIQKSDAEWKEELTDAQYRVLRKAETERAFSSPLNDIEEPGVFVCAACGNELYKTENKFNSGTGWPSFDRPINEKAVGMGSDTKIGYQRDEVHCAKCGGHLGHVFDDGPKKTTGKRHCVNGDAMEFIPGQD